MSSGSDSEEQNFESADEGEETGGKTPVDDSITQSEEITQTQQQQDNVAQPDDDQGVDDKSDPSPADPTVDDDDNNKETTQNKEQADDEKFLHQQNSTDPIEDVAHSSPSQDAIEEESDSDRAAKDSHNVTQPIQSNDDDNNNQSKIQDKSDTSQQQQVQHQPQEQPQQQQSGGSWGWGFSSWISSASDTVAKISKQAHTIGHTVLDTVESSLGVPDPEHLAERNSSSMQDKGEESNSSNTELSKDAKGSEDFLFSSAAALSSMGKQLVTSGIETFEKIGKKTASVITEQEAGITIEKSQPKLSDILREAREKNAEAYLEQPEKESITSKPQPDHFNYNNLLEEFQGQAHLEALEVLSKESDFKIQSLLKTRSEESYHDIMEKVKESFSFELSTETQDNQDFINILMEHVKGLNLEGLEHRVIQVDEDAHSWIKDYQQAHENETNCDSHEVHIEAIKNLAHLTAESIKLFHKAAERFLLSSKEVKTDTTKFGLILSEMAALINDEFSNLGNLYAHCINSTLTEVNSDSSQRQITSIYLEAGNSCSYINDALNFMISIIQFTVLQSRI